MSPSEVIINEQALTSISNNIKTYSVLYKESIGNAVKAIQANCDDWADEDFSSLVAAVAALLKDIDCVESATNQIIERIKNKIEAIHVLHNMKI